MPPAPGPLAGVCPASEDIALGDEEPEGSNGAPVPAGAFIVLYFLSLDTADFEVQTEMGT